MAIPRNLIAQTWFRDVATLNPVSYLLECVRSLIITGWDGQALALGFAVAIALAAASLARRECPRLRLPGRLHGVPVRVRPLSVGRVRRCLHGLRDRARLRDGICAPAA